MWVYDLLLLDWVDRVSDTLLLSLSEDRDRARIGKAARPVKLGKCSCRLSKRVTMLIKCASAQGFRRHGYAQFLFTAPE